MKLTALKIQNFRGYEDEVTITFDALTVIIGRNDAGKSSLLDALNIFFNDAEMDQHDACVAGDNTNVRITCVFSELPTELVLDEQHPTSLASEYLLREDGQLEICRVFNCSAAKAKCTKVYAKSYHPSTAGCSDLLGLKISQLKTRAAERNVNLQGVNQTIKTELRKAIWSQGGDLQLATSDIDLTVETGKNVWEQILLHLPVFALFKSDRASTDQDEEAQDPMKSAIKEAIKQHEAQLGAIVEQVKTKLKTLADKTVEKIQEMSPDLANKLYPQVKNKSWDSLFSVTLTGDEGISINKRGSGTRRLVLLNFFRAKAEDAATSRGTGAIYAVEEPETSQHPNFQLMLLDAFQELTAQGHAQVILTTHTPTLARKVDRNFLRLVTLVDDHPEISHGNADATLHAIKATLGVLPDHDIKVFVGVEGKWDIEFLKRISVILHNHDNTIPNLVAEETANRLVFIPLGGSSMELWTARLAHLDRPEFYITDRDATPPAQAKYHAQMVAWNARANCDAVCTTKRELENYLHPEAIQVICPTFPNAIADFDDVPLMLAEALHTADPATPAWATVSAEIRKQKASRVKRRLNSECVNNMTVARLAASDSNYEITDWLRSIGEILNG